MSPVSAKISSRGRGMRFSRYRATWEAAGRGEPRMLLGELRSRLPGTGVEVFDRDWQGRIPHQFSRIWKDRFKCHSAETGAGSDPTVAPSQSSRPLCLCGESVPFVCFHHFSLSILGFLIVPDFFYVLAFTSCPGVVPSSSSTIGRYCIGSGSGCLERITQGGQRDEFVK